ncbi:hypothetical protein E24_00208 [Faustovirus]|nr:hypothetical protein E24_00208 [Faustovirus]AMN84117.1 hypothetical protein D5a_00206 [Faustovirus]AMN85106.1 hypothetical protein E23_00207 [Faustovirus]
MYLSCKITKLRETLKACYTVDAMRMADTPQRKLFQDFM